MMNLGQKMYFQEHEDIENALNGNSMSIEHVGSISVQGLCAKPILVIILFSAQRDKYASCEKTLAQNTWKYVQNYVDAKSQVVTEIFKHIDAE